MKILAEMADFSRFAKTYSLGKDIIIEQGVSFSGFHGGLMERLEIGDHCYFGKDVNIACPELVVGDYVTIHRRTGIFGEKPCVIGHNCWIGQDCILNTHGFLWIGNNVQIGAANHIWTHAAAGELFEGCLVNYAIPTIIEDDVWICGGHSTINPGVTLAKKTMILPHSVVIKDTIPKMMYRGAPAEELVTAYYTSSSSPFLKKERYKLLDSWIEEFVLKYPEIIVNRYDDIVWVNNTCFDLISKYYEKTESLSEVAFIKFLKGNKIRFVPSDNPVVGKELLEKYGRKE